MKMEIPPNKHKKFPTFLFKFQICHCCFRFPKILISSLASNTLFTAGSGSIFKIIPTKPIPAKFIVKQIQHKIFIAYYRKTAGDYARHLACGLNDFNFDTFLDVASIPDTIINYSDSWHEIRDEALKNSELFILIITRGFEKSDELLYEMQLSDAYNVEKLLMKRKKLGYTDLTVKFEDGNEYDLSKCPILSFTTREDLLRQVLDVLDARAHSLNKIK